MAASDFIYKEWERLLKARIVTVGLWLWLCVLTSALLTLGAG